MTKSFLKMLIQKIRLQLLILQIQYKIAVHKEKLTVPNLKSPVRIILHHGGGWLNAMEVNAYHKHRWGFKSSLGYYMGYTIFIERDGNWVQARADNERGAHTVGQFIADLNERSIGICLAGNGIEKDFTPAQYKTLKKIMGIKLGLYSIDRSEIFSHNYFAPTLCPSPYLEEWIKHYKKGLI